MLALSALLALADPGARSVEAGATVTAEVKSWLLPEAQLDQCLLNTEELKVCRTSLATCADAGRESLQEASDALTAAHARQAADAAFLARCTARTEVLTAQRDAAQRQVRAAGLVALGVSLAAGVVTGMAL